MGYSFAYTRIKDTRTDADSPITEALVQDMASNDAFNNALIRSNGTALYTGAIDSDPTNASSSKVIDAGPTGGAIGYVQTSMLYEVTSGNAIGTIATINGIGTSSNRLSVNTNLYSAGMRSGDTYRVIYGNAADLAHTHSGVDSPLLAANSGTLQFQSGVTSSADHSAYSTITFGTAMATQPIVIAIVKEGASSDVCVIRNITSTGFDVKTGSATVSKVYWFACTPGIWRTNSGKIIHAFQSKGSTAPTNYTWPRPYTTTPFLGVTVQDTQLSAPGAVGGGAYEYFGWQTTATTDLTSGRMGAALGSTSGTNGVLNCIAITATGTPNNGGTYSNSAAGTLLQGQNYEAGFFKITATTGTITFSRTYTAAPVVFLGAVGVDSATLHIMSLTSDTSTTQAAWRTNNNINGCAWVAVDTGYFSEVAARLI